MSAWKLLRFPSPCGEEGVKLQRVQKLPNRTGEKFPSPCGEEGVKQENIMLVSNDVLSKFPSPCGEEGVKLVCLGFVWCYLYVGVSVPLRGRGCETLPLETYALSSFPNEDRRMSFSLVKKLHFMVNKR